MPATVEIEPAFLGIVKAYDHKGDEILPDGKGVITLDHDLQYPPETKHPRESAHAVFCLGDRERLYLHTQDEWTTATCEGPGNGGKRRIHPKDITFLCATSDQTDGEKDPEEGCPTMPVYGPTGQLVLTIHHYDKVREPDFSA